MSMSFSRIFPIRKQYFIFIVFELFLLYDLTHEACNSNLNNQPVPSTSKKKI